MYHHRNNSHSHPVWTAQRPSHLTINPAAAALAPPPALSTPTSAPAHLASFAAAAAAAATTSEALAASSSLTASEPHPTMPGRAEQGGIKTVLLAGARERKRHHSWAGPHAGGTSPAQFQVSRCDIQGCTKAYAGPNAVSNLKRHKANVHHIPLSAQPRHTRWDHNPNRPKDEQERRERMLEAKRKYARKARARQKAAQVAAKANMRTMPSMHAPMPLVPSRAPAQPFMDQGLIFYTPQAPSVALPPSPFPTAPPLRAASVPTMHVPLPTVGPGMSHSLLREAAPSPGQAPEQAGNALGLLGAPSDLCSQFIPSMSFIPSSDINLPPLDVQDASLTNESNPLWACPFLIGPDTTNGSSTASQSGSTAEPVPSFAFPEELFSETPTFSHWTRSEGIVWPTDGSTSGHDESVGQSSLETHLTVPSRCASPISPKQVPNSELGPGEATDWAWDVPPITTTGELTSW